MQDVGVVGEVVEQRRGEGGVAEDLDPAGEVEVGGGEQSAALVAVGAELEEQRAAGPRGRDSRTRRAGPGRTCARAPGSGAGGTPAGRAAAPGRGRPR